MNGLCLAGGGIKGICHVGAIKAFEEEGIKFDCISGTSSGSIVASMYAAGLTSDEMYDIFKKYAKEVSKINYIIILKLIYGIIFKRKIIIDGLNKGKKIKNILNKELLKKDIRNISDIKIPLIIPSVNVYDGSIYMFSSLKDNRNYSDDVVNINDIDIGEAVQASCAYPGVFCPVDYKDVKLVDGGVRENIPWKELKEIGAEKVVSIVFESEKKEKININMLDCITKSMGILMHELYNYEIEDIDYLIKVKTKDISLLEVCKLDELYEVGYETIKMKIKEIKKYLNN